MFDLISVIFLGFIQGVTEFLPISSTGHLILWENFLGLTSSRFGLNFDVAVHLGTLIAVVYFFKQQWIEILYYLKANFIGDQKGKRKAALGRTLLNSILVATLPAGATGLVFEKWIASELRTINIVASCLIFFSLALIYAERYSVGKKSLDKINLWQALFIGVFQAIALIPGVSRSGITIAGGMLVGLKRDEASRFAFLLSVPVVAGAGSKKLVDILIGFASGQYTGADLGLFFIASISAGIFGYMTIKYFLKFISKRSLYPFVVYRILFGSLLLIYFNISTTQSS